MMGKNLNYMDQKERRKEQERETEADYDEMHIDHLTHAQTPTQTARRSDIMFNLLISTIYCKISS